MGKCSNEANVAVFHCSQNANRCGKSSMWPICLWLAYFFQSEPRHLFVYIYIFFFVFLNCVYICKYRFVNIWISDIGSCLGCKQPHFVAFQRTQLEIVTLQGAYSLQPVEGYFANSGVWCPRSQARLVIWRLRNCQVVVTTCYNPDKYPPWN